MAMAAIEQAQCMRAGLELFRRLCGALLLAGSVLWAPFATAQERLDVTGELDVRWVDATGVPSFFDNGLGILRFDPDHEGLRLGHALLVSNLRLAGPISFHLVADAYGDHGSNFAGISEAFFEAQPSPIGFIQWDARLGTFFMPVSMENSGPGWTDVYTITPSALNTWIGEEFRTIGTQVQARWLGANFGYPGDVALTGAVYAWNEQAGMLLAQRGFALTDRPSNVFGSLGEPPTDFYHEVDGRAGYYGAVTWRHRDFLEVRALHYDNLANPDAQTSTAYAWRTRFTTVGARLAPTSALTFIAQYIDGDTASGGPVEDIGPPFKMTYSTVFALTSFEWRRERLTARFDDFRTHQSTELVAPLSNDLGHAWTVGWQHDLGKGFALAAEWIRASSSFPPRTELGEPEAFIESQVQLAVRYRFHAGI
jgi:hypothetical protein